MNILTNFLPSSSFSFFTQIFVLCFFPDCIILRHYFGPQKSIIRLGKKYVFWFFFFWIFCFVLPRDYSVEKNRKFWISSALYAVGTTPIALIFPPLGSSFVCLARPVPAFHDFDCTQPHSHGFATVAHSRLFLSDTIPRSRLEIVFFFWGRRRKKNRKRKVEREGRGESLIFSWYLSHSISSQLDNSCVIFILLYDVITFPARTSGMALRG